MFCSGILTIKPGCVSCSLLCQEAENLLDALVELVLTLLSGVTKHRLCSIADCLYQSLQNTTASKLRTTQIRYAWWAAKAELQGYADQHSTRPFSGLGAVYGPPTSTVTPIRASDGTLLTEEATILVCWTAHFSQLLNKTSSVEDQTIQDMPQRPLFHTLDGSPTKAETVKAIEQLQTGKATGPDGIPPEIFKAGGEALTEQLISLFQLFWERGEVPKDLKDASIVHLYKNKGEKATHDNHRGISLLSIAGKLVARVLLNRVIKHLLGSVVSETQSGFRQNRGTVDTIFAARQLQEKCLEQRQDLYLLFVDLSKAFDTVRRPGLWSILSKLGCPPKFISMVRSLYDGMMARVIENSDVSDPFAVTNGVKQGCVLAPNLFSLLFAEMLSAAPAKTSAGTTIHYITDGRFFDLRRLKANTKMRLPVCRRLCIGCSPKRTCNAWLTVSLLLPRPLA